MAIPKLAMIPSGYKANKVYSVLPTDGSGDLDSARTTTARRVNSDGLIEEVAIGVPRLDYTDGGCPSLLLEPSSTNLIAQSEAFDNVYWTKSGATVTSGFSAPSVDSPLGAFELVEGSNNGQHWFYKDISLSANTSYTISLFAKYSGRKNIAINIYNGASSDYAYYDIQNGAILNTPSDAKATITPISNGWYRLTYTREALTTGANYRIALADNTPSESYQGDGTSGAYIFGAQIEEQSSATSYIPTAGTTISRTADTASKSGISSLINSSQGVLFVEMSALSNPTSLETSISLSEGTSGANRLLIRYKTNGDIGVIVRVANSTVADMNFSLTNQSDFNKIAVKYKENDFALWVNGVEEGTDSSGVSFSANTLDSVRFDQGNNSNFFNGKIKDLRVYKTILSDSELQILTTI